MLVFVMLLQLEVAWASDHNGQVLLMPPLALLQHAKAGLS